MSTSHEADLELARRCAAGEPAAWDRFVLEYRPVLYRAADALDASGRAREVADSLYAELYGMKDANGERQSLFRYFQGRSSLGTWLRAVLAQRYVDVMRAGRRLEPLPDDHADARGLSDIAARAADAGQPDLERPHYVAAIRAVLGRALARLSDRERLRLACYYVQQLTLAEIGRALGEHEATVSRQLARTRKAMREQIEIRLQRDQGFSADEVRECLSSMMDDAGTLDLGQLLKERKKTAMDRSRVEDVS